MELNDFEYRIEKIRQELSEFWYVGLCTGINRSFKVSRDLVKEHLRECFDNKSSGEFWWGSCSSSNEQENSPRRIALDLFELYVIDNKLYKEY